MKNVALNYGVTLFMCLMGFFTLMYATGMGTHFNLRFFNGAIHFTVLYFALKEYFNTDDDKYINYFKGIAVGILTTLVGMIPFAGFQITHLALNNEFLLELQANTSLGEMLTPAAAGLVLMVEGLFMGFMSSYLIVRITESRSEKPYIPNVE